MAYKFYIFVMVSQVFPELFFQKFSSRFSDFFPAIPEPKPVQGEEGESLLYYWPLENVLHSFFFVEFFEHELVLGTQAEHWHFKWDEADTSNGQSVKKAFQDALVWIDLLLHEQILTIRFFRDTGIIKKKETLYRTLTCSLKERNIESILTEIRQSLGRNERIEAFTWSKKM